VKINKQNIYQKINTSAAKAADPAALIKANGVFIGKKETLLRNFDSHPITQELEDQTSHLRGGLGIESSRDPALEIKQILQDEITINTVPIVRKLPTYAGNINRYYMFKINVPDLKDFAPVSLSWATENAVYFIEKGIPGFFKTFFKTGIGRSEQAVQSQYGVRAGDKKLAKGRKYISALLETFRSRFKTLS
jgi:hypothetical protein